MTVPIRSMTDPAVIRLASRVKAMIRSEVHFAQILAHSRSTGKSLAGVPLATYIDTTASSLSYASHARANEQVVLNHALRDRGATSGMLFSIDGYIFRVANAGCGVAMHGPVGTVDEVPEEASVAIDAALAEPGQSDRDYRAERDMEYYAAVGATGRL